MNISRILTTTLAAAFTLPALADIPASRVPAPVKEQVQKQYPDGTVCLIKADMRLQDLPAPVTAAIARDFPGYAPRRVKQITARGALKYRVDCRSETAAVRKLELYYAPDGKLLSQKADD